MEILIIGAGAMGGLFGALLAPHAEVCLYTTNPDHAVVINRDGLTVIGGEGVVRRCQIRVLSDPGQYDRRADLVLICTKARSTAEAAQVAQPLLADTGLVLTLQNGLGNLEQIVAEVGVDRAVAGITAQAATLVGPGQVRHAGSGPTVLAAGPEQCIRVAAIVALFNRAGIDTHITEDGDSLLWSKLIVNVGINALTALLRVPNGILAQVTACEALMDQAVAEAVAVARGLHINLAYEQQLDRVKHICALTSENRASMLQDILRGAPTEIDVINGAIVAKGRDVGVPTPVNLLLTQLIKALEATAPYRIFAKPPIEPRRRPCHRKS